MRGIREADFFGMINESFICLFGAAIQHCLKEWLSGEAPTNLIDFKFETAGGRSLSDMVNLPDD